MGIRMSIIPLEVMTSGQLKLEFASICRFHGCDAIAALTAVMERIPAEELRAALVEYRMAAEDENWEKAQDILCLIAEANA